MTNQVSQTNGGVNIYEWADELDGRRVDLGITLGVLARRMPQYAARTVEQFRRLPNRALLAAVEAALDALALEREAAQAQDADVEGVFTTGIV